MNLVKYQSAQEFLDKNSEAIENIKQAKTRFRSLAELGMSGDALGSAESLAFDFLHLANVVTDIKLGLSASLLEAKAAIKSTEGILFRTLDLKTATDKNKVIPSCQSYVDKSTIYHDLLDVKEYLDGKKEDFMANYYYYKQMSAGK